MRKRSPYRSAQQRVADDRAVRKHIDLLIESGMRYADIARLTHINYIVVRRAHTGETSPRTRTRERILAVRPGDINEDFRMEAWRSQMLVAEIKRAGLTNAELSVILKRSHRRGVTGLLGPDRVSVKTYRRVALIFEALERQGRVRPEVLALVMTDDVYRPGRTR